MSIRLGDIAPDFEQDSSEGRIRFHEWLGDSWGVLFSHPADFTPVCTTELGFTAKLKDEFAKRNVKAIALSVDPVDSHIKWIDDINETQNTRVNFPILADADRKVSELYDLIHPNANDTLTVRSLFVIDPNKKVRLTITYPASTGRNFHEILRVIDSLQLTDNHKVATPANWQDGDEVVIVPSLKDEEEIESIYLVGSDYVFSRTANKIIKQYAKEHDIEVKGEQYQPLGSTSFGSVVDKVKAADADAVFNTLNGDSNVAFFKEYKGKGLTASEMPVMSVSIAEEEVPGIGVGNLKASPDPSGPARAR